VLYFPFRARTPETITGDLWLVTEDDQLLGRITGLMLKSATLQTLLSDSEKEIESLLYEGQWKKQARTEHQAEFWPEPKQLTEVVKRLAASVAKEEYSLSQELPGKLEELSRPDKKGDHRSPVDRWRGTS
jgi:hypothetical protein